MSLWNKTKFVLECRKACSLLLCSIGFVLCINANALANDLLRQYSAELLRFESVQVTENTTFNYAHPVYGVDLRRLLDKGRAALIIDAFIKAKMNEGEKTEVPNLSNQFGPIHRRIERAFHADPANYEAEYLDSLTWTIEMIVRSNEAARDQFNKPIPNTPGIDAQQMQQLMQSMQGLQSTLIKVVAQSIQAQIDQGKFTATGVTRAKEIIVRLASSAQASISSNQTGTKFRQVANGKQVYEAQCAYCHAGGVAVSPRFGDKAAWQPRLNQGLEKLIANTLRGKGAMVPQSGGDWQDFEIARAVVYMANSAGANFGEPPAPANHPGLVEVREKSLPRPASTSAIPYPLMNAAEKLNHGEKVYFANCVACHQVQGQGAGTVIPPLAPSARSMAPSKLVQIVLNGQNGGRMPAWRQLQDTEIASVVNYMRIKFGGKAESGVQPDDVEKFRR